MRCLSVAAVGLVLLAPAAAHSYQQTMTCTETGTFACEAGEEPKAVKWRDLCIHYYINENGSSEISTGGIDAQTLSAIQGSFGTWSAVPQSALALEYAGLTNEDRAEYVAERGPARNANVIMFRDETWPYEAVSPSAFAITSVTFDPSTGVIADADIELNGANPLHRFTVGDVRVDVDVRNTLTHEAGHFLGLDHSDVADSTMYRQAPRGEVQKRNLHADDVEGLVSIYPETGQTVLCSGVPAYFEKPTDEDDKGCCAVATGERRDTPASAFLVLLAVLIVRRKRGRDS